MAPNEEEDFALLGRSSALFKEDIFNFSQIE